MVYESTGKEPFKKDWGLKDQLMVQWLKVKEFNELKEVLTRHQNTLSNTKMSSIFRWRQGRIPCGFWHHPRNPVDFYVQESAIPEFPAVIAAIAVCMLCAIPYIFMRRKVIYGM